MIAPFPDIIGTVDQITATKVGDDWVLSTPQALSASSDVHFAKVYTSNLRPTQYPAPIGASDNPFSGVYGDLWGERTRFKKGTINVSTFLNMYTTPFILVDVLNIDRVNYPRRLVLEFTYGGVPYADGGNVTLQWGTAPGGLVAMNIATATEMYAIAEDGAFVQSKTVEVFLPRSSTMGMELTLTNDGGVFTGGDGMQISYSITYTESDAF